MEKKFAELVFDNLGWEGMEAYLCEDGDMGLRQAGSFGAFEDDIVKKVALGRSMWHDDVDSPFDELTVDDVEEAIFNE